MSTPIPISAFVPTLSTVKELEPTLNQTTTSVSTVIQLTQVHVEQKVTVLEDIKENVNSLSAKQKEVLDQLYVAAKETTKGIISLQSADHVFTIGRMMAEIVKLTEKASYRGEKIPGAEKKEIALELGKRLVSDPAIISDETIRNGLLTAYDLLGEQLLDTLIDVSQHVNTAIKEVAISCCEALLRMLKK
jgi:hypothetical protein